MNELLKLAERCESAAGADSEISAAIHKLRGFLEWDTYCPHYTASIDAAMTLLPGGAVNHNLFSFGGHGREGIGKFAWGFTFHDTAQVMGERAATEEIARLRKASPTFNELRGEPLLVMEKAIAEHWLEFRGTRCATPALALCAAALRARAAQ